MPTFAPFISACLAILFLGGCSTGFYKKRADKGVYEILKKVENDIFGESSGFSIDTPTSGKKTKDVTALKLLKSRNKGGEITLSLDQALGYAIKNSREYQSEKEKLYLTALNLTGERHNFRPSFFAVSYTHLTLPTNREV